MTSKLTKRERKFPRWGALVAAALLCLLPPLARRVQIAAGSITCKEVYAYNPAGLALHVFRVAQGGPLYPDLRKPPYGYLGYGPVIPYLTASIARTMRSNAFGCIEAGRIETAAASIGTGVLIFVFAAQFSSPPAALMAALGFLLSPLMVPWGFEFRVDMPTVFFELLGLYFFRSGLDLLPLGFFLLALFTKFRIAGITAVTLYAWFHGQRWRAVKIGGSWIALALLISGILRTTQPYYLLNLLGSHVPFRDLSVVPELLAETVAFDFSLVVLAWIGLSRGRHPVQTFVAWFLPIATAEALILSTRWGSDLNYFLEPLAAVAILAAAGIDVAIEASLGWKRAIQLLAGVSLAAAMVIPAMVEGQLHIGDLLKGDLSNVSWCDPPWSDGAMLKLTTTPGPILTDMGEISFITATEVWNPPFDMLNAMHAYGLFNDAALVGAVRDRKFPMIVLEDEMLSMEYRGRNFFWPELRQAIATSYCLVPGINPPNLLIPKPPMKPGAPPNTALATCD